jgi:hypothetical protein
VCSSIGERAKAVEVGCGIENGLEGLDYWPVGFAVESVFSSKLLVVAINQRVPWLRGVRGCQSVEGKEMGAKSIEGTIDQVRVGYIQCVIRLSEVGYWSTVVGVFGSIDGSS